MNVSNILANNPSKKFNTYVKVGEGAHGNVYKACRRGACPKPRA